MRAVSAQTALLQVQQRLESKLATLCSTSAGRAEPERNEDGRVADADSGTEESVSPIARLDVYMETFDELLMG